MTSTFILQLFLEELLRKCQDEFSNCTDPCIFKNGDKNHAPTSGIYSAGSKLYTEPIPQALSPSDRGIDSGHNSPTPSFHSSINLSDRKPKLLGITRFIGELGKQDLLPEAFLFDCLRTLLSRSRSTPVVVFQENLEAAVQLLKIVGKKLDHQLAKALMDQYFSRISGILTSSNNIEKRTRFLLSDLVQLRESGWGGKWEDHSENNFGSAENKPTFTNGTNHPAFSSAPSPSTSPSTTSSSSGFNGNSSSSSSQYLPCFMPQPTPPPSGGINQKSATSMFQHINGKQQMPSCFFFPPSPNQVSPMMMPPTRAMVPGPPGGIFQGHGTNNSCRFMPQFSVNSHTMPPNNQQRQDKPWKQNESVQLNGKTDNASTFEVCPSFVDPNNRQKKSKFPYDPSSNCVSKNNKGHQYQSTPRTFANVSSGLVAGHVEMTKIGTAKKGQGKQPSETKTRVEQVKIAEQSAVSLRPQGCLGKPKAQPKASANGTEADIETVPKENGKVNHYPVGSLRSTGECNGKVKAILSQDLLGRVEQQVIKQGFNSLAELVNTLETMFHFSSRPSEMSYHLLVASLEASDEHKEQCQMVLSHFRNQGQVDQQQLDHVFAELVSSINTLESFISCVKSHVATHLAIAISFGLQSIKCLPLAGIQHPVALIAVQRTVKLRGREAVFQLFDNSRAATNIVQADIFSLLPEALLTDREACVNTLKDRGLDFLLFNFSLPQDILLQLETDPGDIDKLANDLVDYIESFNFEPWQLKSLSMANYLVNALKEACFKTPTSVKWSNDDLSRLLNIISIKLNWKNCAANAAVDKCLTEVQAVEQARE